jgi:hypothetical protein
MMVLADHEVPVAYSMVALVVQPSALAFPPFHTFGCYWMAFNNIYVTIADRSGRCARLKKQPDGSLRTRLIANVNIPEVMSVSERHQMDLAFDAFAEDLKHRLIEHPSVRYFVYRTPSWHSQRLEHDAAGQRLNGVLNVGYTVSADHPVWSPIDTQLYERYMGGSQDKEARNVLGKQILNLLYTVRNNTFHGGKRADDANDREVVEQALPLLVMIVKSFLKPEEGTS